MRGPKILFRPAARPACNSDSTYESFCHCRCLSEFKEANVFLQVVMMDSGQGWVLDGTVDKTWFKPDKTGQNLRKAINHSNGCETIEDE